MKTNVKIENWQLAWAENIKVNEQNVCLKTPADVAKIGYQTIAANVPGNFELDFMREMYCFAPGEEAAGREIINDFIRDVRAHLDSLEVTYGHKIEIAVRVPATPYDAYEAGYDVYTWDKEALVETSWHWE